MTPPPLILASASATRLRLLRDAGLTVIGDPAQVDEAALKASAQAEGRTVEQTAEALAWAKARQVAPRHLGAVVLGADQMLECQGSWFDKPAGRDEARSQLLALRGRRHRLVSAVVAVAGETRLWHHVAEARLDMRAFSADFLDSYLDRAGEAVQHTVGAYHLEGLGAQLMARVEGDFFTVLGLPLLPLLDYLRTSGVIAG